MEMFLKLSDLDKYPYYCLIKSGLTNEPIVRNIAEPLKSTDRFSFSSRFRDPCQELVLHTDTAFLKYPYQYVGLQFVKTDPYGGVSKILPIEALLKLPPHLLQQLEEVELPYRQGGCYPILNPIKKTIRYHRDHLATAQINLNFIEVLDKLDHYAVNHPDLIEIHAQPGDLLFLNNSKVLHGRSAYNPNSQRFIYRVRFDAKFLH